MPGRGAWTLLGFIPLCLFGWKSSMGTQAAGESQAGWAMLISAEHGWFWEDAGDQGPFARVRKPGLSVLTGF